ncbi:MAG: DedA family protein [bacterium]
MAYFLNPLISLLLSYKYITLFLIIFSGGIIVPWPENTLLLATGAFASQGYLNLAISFIVALTANILGDSIGYYLTKRWGYKIIKESKIKKYKYVKQAEKYLLDHSGITIFISRFVGAIGQLVNFMSGLIGISFRHFILFDIIGNALEIGIFMVAGYLLGNTWRNFLGITDIVGWILLAFFLINILINFFRKIKKT